MDEKEKWVWLCNEALDGTVAHPCRSDPKM